MSDDVLIAIIGTLGVLGGATISMLSTRGLRRKMSDVHDSTVNSHGPDLRADLDRKFGQVFGTLSDVQANQTRTDLRVTEHLAQSAQVWLNTQRRQSETDEHMEQLRELMGEQSSTLASLAEALPIVARSTPPEES